MKFFPHVVLPLMVAVSGHAAANELNFPHIATTGYGQVTAKPDMARFSVKVVESTMTAEQAKKAVDNTVNEFLAELTSAGVEKDDISSSNLHLSPQYHYPQSGKAELVGYRASRSITVEVEQLNRLNEFLDLALTAGINQVDNIELRVKDEFVYQEQARQAAIQDAVRKGHSLAEGFERGLGDVWRINYQTPSSQPVLTRSMMMDAKAEMGSYQDSSIVIRDQVDVIFQIQ